MPDEPQADPYKFVFELDRAIRDQVLERLDEVQAVPLTNGCAPRESGVYAIFWKGDLVYVGKASKDSTKSKRTLRGRLNEHLRKLENRQNLSVSDLTCKFLTIDSDWFVWAAEFALINHFKPAWNGSGLGSKTPGAGRLGTGKISKFAALFPLIEGYEPKKRKRKKSG